MLYKENIAKTLSAELFADPPAAYRGAPFWSFNCKLDKAQLLRQIEQLKAMGFGGFHMHARSGLETAYMSDEFMALIRACCDKAEAEDMLAWLYDEDRWASGSAGGRVTAERKYRRRLLKLFTDKKEWNASKADAVENGEPYLLAAYDVQLDADGYLAAFRRIGANDTAVGMKWYAYSVCEGPSTWWNNQTYIDIMDKEAVRRFIDLSYERYKEVVGDKFDKSVPAIFTDEPHISNGMRLLSAPTDTGCPEYGWSRFFEEEFEKRYGEDILDKLPLLIWNTKDRSDAIVKYRYFDLCGRLFYENFSKQIGEWCNQNGIAFTGHMLNEPDLRGQTYSCGETMRQYEAFDLPGIDMLCNWREYTTAKQTQSAVHQYGKEGMMSELYGVTNWDFDFRGHKFQGDWQAALGVTVRVPHLAWVSMAGEAKRDYPAAIGYQSPWYKEYPLIENHFARLNTALTRGKPLVNIGVIHPVEGYWTSVGPTSQMGAVRDAQERNFHTLASMMLSLHLDYDYICESALPALRDPADPKKVGRMRYEAILVPACLSLRQSTVEHLEAFRKAGGQVIFIGECPAFVGGVPGDGCRALYDTATHIDMDAAQLAAALSPQRQISICTPDGEEDTAYVYAYREDTDGRWLFICRKDLPQEDEMTPARLTVSIKGVFTPVEYITTTGEIAPCACTYENGDTVVSRELYASDSLLLKLLPGEAKAMPQTTAKTVPDGKAFARPVAFTLSEPNVLLLDMAAYALDDGEWQPREEILRLDNILRDKLQFPKRAAAQAQPYTLPQEKICHTAHLRLIFQSEIAYTGALLAVEDAEKLGITFNGETVDNAVLGYFTDESIKTVLLPPIVKGENVLLLDVPFGQRTNLEWCYVLGDFGVRLQGETAIITAPPKTLTFGDVTAQGLPFYGANISYHMEVALETAATVQVHVPCYRGAAVNVEVDGVPAGNVTFAPYLCTLADLSAGKHIITLTLYGNRFNSFGQLHLANAGPGYWYGPDSWRTGGEGWTYEYRVRPFGILEPPTLL